MGRRAGQTKKKYIHPWHASGRKHSSELGTVLEVSPSRKNATHCASPFRQLWTSQNMQALRSKEHSSSKDALSYLVRYQQQYSTALHLLQPPVHHKDVQREAVAGGEHVRLPDVQARVRQERRQLNTGHMQTRRGAILSRKHVLPRSWGLDLMRTQTHIEGTSARNADSCDRHTHVPGASLRERCLAGIPGSTASVCQRWRT